MAIRTDLQNKANVIGSTMIPKVGPSNQYGEVKKLMDGLKQVPSGPAAGDRQVQQQNRPQARRAFSGPGCHSPQPLQKIHALRDGVFARARGGAKRIHAPGRAAVAGGRVVFGRAHERPRYF